MIKIIWQVVTGAIMVGLLIALLRMFDWDVIALIEWILNFLFTIVSTISDWFMNNDTFINIVKK